MKRFLLSIGLATAVLAGGPLQAEDKVIIICYDESRQSVVRTTTAKCQGRILSDAEAQKIKDRRAAAIRQALQPRRKAVKGRRLRGHGSGFFIHPDGVVVTNAHVVAGCKAVSVASTNGKEAKAKLLTYDKTNDLAVLKADMGAPGIAYFRPDVEPDDGAEIFVVGYPTRTLPTIRPQLATARYLHDGNAVIRNLRTPPAYRKIRGEVFPGNSGGPAFDNRGRVAGVIVAKINTVEIFQETGSLIRDLGFFIDPKALFKLLNTKRIPYLVRNDDDPDLPPPADGKTVAERMRPVVARINCWK